MAQKLDYPTSEIKLRQTLDLLYEQSRHAVSIKEKPRFKGLLEVISSETTILTAIHNIKSNKGSKTPGSDGQTMDANILQKDYEETIQLVQETFRKPPKPVRRVYIPKTNGELRPLGIPSILDRIIQECVRIVIEPILEAQFIDHSYGFRPMRDTHMAINRCGYIPTTTGYHWVIEGDISKFFDNVNHRILLKKLWNMGIRDRRVLMIIKGMLEAGVMDEITHNEIGTPQGGIISPLLANAYLHKLDQWIIREWEEKQTRINYSRKDSKIMRLRKDSNLKPAYFVRYADDWVLITDTRANADKWKRRIAKYLGTNLKLTLSNKKTLVTNIKRRSMKFLGFQMKVTDPSKDTNKKLHKIIRPDPKKIKLKVKGIRENIRGLRRFKDSKKKGFKEALINDINKINSQIRGLINYFEVASHVNKEFNKYSKSLKYTAYKALKPYGGDWSKANETSNLTSVHSEYTQYIPTIMYNDMKVGITSIGFVRWKFKQLKNQEESPYSVKGRKLYKDRTNKKPLLVRADEILSADMSELISQKITDKLYNFEYYLNRPYAFNRDKGKCRCCKDDLYVFNVHIHHIDHKLPIHLVNKVTNLASVCKDCHARIHSTQDYPNLDPKVMNKIRKLRQRL